MRPAAVFGKISKRERTVWLVFTVFLSAVTALGCQLTFSGRVYGRPEEYHFNPPGLKTVFVFIAAMIVTNALACFLCLLNGWYQSRRMRVDSRNTEPDLKKVFLISFGILFFAWLPYFLTCLPGGLYVDTILSISQAQNMDELGYAALNNHHPVLYALLWRIFIVFGNRFNLSLTQVIEIFYLFQYLLMTAVLSWLFVWLRAHGLRGKIYYVTLGFAALFPLFPMYMVSLWKDTIFSLFLLLFSLCLGECVLTKSDKLLCSGKYLIKTAVLGILVCFFRNNGKYIVFLTFFIIGLLNLKKIRKLKKFFFMMLSVVILTTAIQGPLYNRLGYNVDRTVESIGIPMQQIAYLVYYDYDLSDDEKAYIDSICRIDEIKENYNPGTFDAIKWNAAEFDSSVIYKDPVKFLKYYFRLLAEHPVGCVKAYLLSTSGFWAPNIASVDGYVQTLVWTNDYGVETHYFIEDHFGIPARKIVGAIKPVSSALFLYVLLYAAVFLFLNRDYKKLLILLPSFTCWLTVMIATPICCSFRYVYILVLMIPVDLYLICTSRKNDSISDAKEKDKDTLTVL